MDITEFFDDHDIQYWTEGKNVTKGWVNIQCPFCDDDSNHLGIKLDDFRCSCWKCGKKNIIRTIKEVLNISYREAKDHFKKLDVKNIIRIVSEYENAEIGRAENFVVFPKEATKHFPKMHKDYLRSRGLKPLETIRKYKLRSVYNFGKYRFRIIIPIFKYGKIITYTSRDVSGYSKIKYLHAGPKECLVKAKNTIYGFDEIPKGGDAVLVEGVFDKWKLGSGAIGSFGTTISGKQMVELSEMEINNLFIFFDNDKPGRIAAKRVSKELAPLAKHTEIIRLDIDYEDPGKLTREQAELVMRSLGFKR